jgi:hypothetical protein
VADQEKDVFGRVDALMRRNAAVGTETGSVPILTDLIDDGGKLKDELAHEVFRRVMLQVEGRLSHDLEARLAQHLAPQIHAAVISALTDLRQELANAIGDAVHEALAARKTNP